MAKILNNSDFFKSRMRAEEDAVPVEKSPSAVEEKQQVIPPVKKLEAALAENTAPLAAEKIPFQLEKPVQLAIHQTMKLLKEMDQPKLAARVEQMYKTAVSERFTAAVVGEFSRGKSTFVNAFLGQEILPVGILPTTAMLTRIRYNEKPVLLCFDQNGKRSAALPLKLDSWDGLVADNLEGSDPTGTAMVGINDPWLKEMNVELMDTPGAGDLEQKRAQVIGEALLSADAAIITVSANAALSDSEKLFIEQRLIARKTPYLMLILTKLDTIPLKERSRVVQYVHSRLESWGMNIPVYIPYEMEMPDDSYQDIIGMDKVKAQLSAWINDPERVQLTQRWLISKTLSVLSLAGDSLEEQKKLLDADAEERAKKLAQKQEILSKAELVWGDLRVQMMTRCNACYDWLRKKTEESAAAITERLQYEATMTGAPQKWWRDSYPYRLKIELTNMASSVDTAVSRMVAADAKWLNMALEKQFKTNVSVEKETIADKSIFGDFSGRKDVEFEDLDKQRNMVRIGTTVLTIGGALLCSSIGAFPLVATLGVGTGSSIISEKIFKDKVENQKEAIRKAIAQNVPELLENAMGESEKRIQDVYNDIIQEARIQEELWLQTQRELIVKAVGQTDPAAVQLLQERLEALDEMSAHLIGLAE